MAKHNLEFSGETLLTAWPGGVIRYCRIVGANCNNVGIGEDTVCLFTVYCSYQWCPSAIPKVFCSSVSLFMYLVVLLKRGAAPTAHGGLPALSYNCCEHFGGKHCVRYYRQILCVRLRGDIENWENYIRYVYLYLSFRTAYRQPLLAFIAGTPGGSSLNATASLAHSLRTAE